MESHYIVDMLTEDETGRLVRYHLQIDVRENEKRLNKLLH